MAIARCTDATETHTIKTGKRCRAYYVAKDFHHRWYLNYRMVASVAGKFHFAGRLSIDEQAKSWNAYYDLVSKANLMIHPLNESIQRRIQCDAIYLSTSKRA